jgi:hypothetical protein
MFEIFKKKAPLPPPPPGFPPVPKWRPTIAPPLDQVIDRVSYYTDRKRDFAVFANGTCVILTSGLSDEAAVAEALTVLTKIFRFHPDMNPQPMDDGNILVQYNHPAINVVIDSFAMNHWAEIDLNHQGALAGDEVLITPLGPNKFDDFGKKALYGRCFMFMDAQEPKVVRVVRAVV